jgi:hypothetical protein
MRPNEPSTTYSNQQTNLDTTLGRAFRHETVGVKRQHIAIVGVAARDLHYAQITLLAQRHFQHRFLSKCFSQQQQQQLVV